MTDKIELVRRRRRRRRGCEQVEIVKYDGMIGHVGQHGHVLAEREERVDHGLTEAIVSHVEVERGEQCAREHTESSPLEDKRAPFANDERRR